jgi:hypothetical protein
MAGRTNVRVRRFGRPGVWLALGIIAAASALYFTVAALR